MAAEEPLNLLSPGKRHCVALAVTSLGAVGILSQLTLLRETLCVFSGNELCVGIVLGNWLLLLGLGTSLGRGALRVRNPLRLLMVLLVLLSALGPLQLLAVRMLPGMILSSGESPDVGQCVAGTLVLLGPSCLTAGFVLALAGGVLAAREGAWSAARVYVAEGIGGVIGAGIFWQMATGAMGHMTLLCAAAAGQLAVVVLLGIVFARKPLAVVASVGVLGALAATIVGDLGGYSTRVQYPADEVLYRGHGPRGRLVVTHTQGRLRFVLNGQPVLSTQNFAHAEEAVHYAMAQRPDARSVLLISGGLAGTTGEVLKYPWVSDLVCVEPEPEVLRQGRRFLPHALANDRIRTPDVDARTFIRQTPSRFDVIIIDVPPAATLAMNRHFTREFLTEAAAVLEDGGVLAVGFLSPSAVNVGERDDAIATLVATLPESLPGVLVIPGTTRWFLLASIDPLHADIEQQLTDAGIQTVMMTPKYVRTVLSPDRMQTTVGDPVQNDAPINDTLHPVLYLSHAGRWLWRVNLGFTIGVGVLGAAILIFVARLRPAAQALFAGGFARAGLQVAALLGLQAICGTLYGQLGPLVTAVMMGHVLGAFVGKGISPASVRGRLVCVAVALAACAAAMGPVLAALAAWSHRGACDGAIEVAVGVMMFVVAAVAGVGFPVAAQASAPQGQSVSRLYTAYCFGGFLGAVLVGVVGPVVVGLTWAPAIAAAVSVAALISLTVRRV